MKYPNDSRAFLDGDVVNRVSEGVQRRPLARPNGADSAPASLPGDLRAALNSVAEVRGCTQPGRRWFPHPFPARMPPEVAARAIEEFTLPGQVVLDPMSGSGVVPYAARNAGRLGIGRDVDPLAILLGRSLCAQVDAGTLRSYSDDVHREASAHTRKRRTPSSYTRNLGDEDRKFLAYWFPGRSLVEMFALAEVILEDARNPLALVAAVMLSSLVIARESGVSLAMDLSRSRPHKVASKKPKTPLAYWKEKSEAFARFYESNSVAPSAPLPDINLGDARSLHLATECVDAIITSPPYVNAIDYIRTSKFALIFFGCELATLREIRSTAIGTEVGLPTGHLPPHLDELVGARVKSKERRPMLRRYIFDLGRVLAEAYRVLKPRGVALYVLGPSIASRKTYDSVMIFSTLAREYGFEVLGDAKRSLSATNRSLPPPNRGKRRKSMNRRMTCEFYVALRKHGK